MKKERPNIGRRHVGFAYTGNYGDTATYARQEGERVSSPAFVFGIRVWR